MREYKNTATFELHRLLRDVYPAQVIDPATFERNLASVYDARIRRRVAPSFSTLGSDALKVPFDRSLDAKEARAAFLTVLGAPHDGRRVACVDRIVWRWRSSG